MAYDFLWFRLGHQLDPYVTSLSFQLVITKTNGRLWSSLSDTLKAGDILPIPAPTDSGVRVYLTPARSFEFLARIIETPTKAYESYYCGKIGYGVTTQVCRNIMWFSIIDTDEAICQVQPASSVGEKNDGFLRVQFQLRQNHPNPFNASTSIEFALPRATEVSLKVFTLHGEVVAALLNQSKFAAGRHRISWNTKNLPSGIYLYRLHTNDGFVAVRKLVLLK